MSRSSSMDGTVETAYADLEDGGSSGAVMTKTQVWTNFLAMSIAFSLNHGCVTACVALASSDLGTDLGAWSSGTLYLLYTLCALLGANAIVHYTGAKYGIASALLFYCTYIASFIVARKTDGEVKWVSAVLGSVIGGVAAGYLWTAQGPFMQAAAQLYAPFVEDDKSDQLLKKSERMSTARLKANSLFAALFGCVYLLAESFMKVLSTWIPTQFDGGETTVYVVFTIISVLSAFAMVFVSDLTAVVRASKQTKGSEDDKKTLLELVTAKSFAAVDLLFSDPKMILLYPVQMGFGFAGSFVGYYANGVLVKNCVNTHSTNYIGYFAALIAFTAAVMSPLLSLFTRKLCGGRKVYVMVLGIVCFLVEMSVYMAYDLHTDELQHGEKLCATAPLVVLYLVHGVGRGVWESTNKAVILDFFPDKPMAAFANVIVSSGLASTIGFFMYQFDKDLVNHPLVVTTLTVVLCALSLVTYPTAVYLHTKKDQ